MKLIKAVVILLFCCSSASALELAEMQKMALENRQLVKQYITSLEKSEQDIVLAKSANYPSFDVAYTSSLQDSNFLSIVCHWCFCNLPQILELFFMRTAKLRFI